MMDIQAMFIDQEGTGPMKNGRYMPYRDTRGKLTIGYGRCLDEKGISHTEAEMLFHGDIADAIEDSRHCCSVYDALPRPRQLVLVSMAYNLGREKLGQFVRFLDALHREEWDAAADEILDSQAARTDAPARYAQLAHMMRTNTSPWV